MLILLISFSQRALIEGARLKEKLETERYSSKVELVYGGSFPAVGEFGSEVKDRIASYFAPGNDSEARGIIFISSAGIAVRMISPYLVHKSVDPAVLVIDEKLMHCISLLSGHLGGANRLCHQVAEITGADPVITTATDVNDLFSPDIYASDFSLKVSDFDMAKKISAASVAGEMIGIKWEDDVYGQSRNLDASYGVYVSDRITEQGNPFDNSLILYPQTLVLGVGCKRETTEADILFAVNDCFQKHGLFTESICAVVSIELKKEEPGIVSLAERLGVEFVTFGCEDLKETENKYGDGFFSSSEFVRGVAGVNCVCEESVMAYGASELIVPKNVYPGVTLAVGRIVKL